MKSQQKSDHNLLCSWLIYLAIGLVLFSLVSFGLNTLFGFRGVIYPQEEVSHRCILPGTYAICVKSEGETFSFPLSTSHGKVLGLSSLPLSIEILKEIPHAQQKFKCLSKNGAHVHYHASVLEVRQNAGFLPVEVELGDEAWAFAALKSDSIAHAAALLSSYSKKPLVAFVKDEKHREYICIKEKNQELQISSLAFLMKKPLNPHACSVDLKIGKDHVTVKIDPSIEVLQPSSKDNTPALYVLFKENNQLEDMTLVYDPKASSVEWNVFAGKYRARFQPLTKDLPFKVHHFSDHYLLVENNKGQLQRFASSPNSPLNIQRGYSVSISQASLEVHHWIVNEILIYASLVAACLLEVFRRVYPNTPKN